MAVAVAKDEVEKAVAASFPELKTPPPGTREEDAPQGAGASDGGPKSPGPSDVGPARVVPLGQGGPGKTPDSPKAPFRRRGVIRSHRRRRPFLAFLAFLARGVLIGGVPVAALAWGLTTPRLGIQEFRIQGTQKVPAAWVDQVLAPLQGRNLFQVSLAEVQGRLQEHPWVASASVRKRLPDGLEVVIRERQPVALAESPRGLVLVDAAGVVIAEASAGPETAALPVVSGAQAPEEVARALEIFREFQRVGGGRLLKLEILGPDDYRLTAEGLPYPLLVGSGSLEEKHAYLDRLRAAVEARGQRVKAVDLRFAQRIVLQPEDAPASAGGRLPSRG